MESIKAEHHSSPLANSLPAWPKNLVLFSRPCRLIEYLAQRLRHASYLHIAEKCLTSLAMILLICADNARPLFCYALSKPALAYSSTTSIDDHCFFFELVRLRWTMLYGFILPLRTRAWQPDKPEPIPWTVALAAMQIVEDLRFKALPAPIEYICRNKKAYHSATFRFVRLIADI